MEFKTYLSERYASENTVKSYCYHVAKYLKWYEQTYGMKFEQLIRENILDYRAYLLNIKKLKPKTINSEFSALKQFNDFLIEAGVQASLVISDKDLMKVTDNHLSPAKTGREEVSRIRQKILMDSGRRDHAIVTVMAYTGLRVSEVISIELDNINLEAKQLFIKGKGEKYRAVYLNNKVVHAIKNYLEERNSDSPYLFVSRNSSNNGKLSRSTVNRFLKKYTSLSPHQFRHFFCTECKNAGMDLTTVAYLAGHNSIQTTMKNEHPSEKDIDEKLNQL